MEGDIRIKFHCGRCHAKEEQYIGEIDQDDLEKPLKCNIEGWAVLNNTLLCPKCKDIEVNITPDKLQEKSILLHYIGESHQNDPVYDMYCPTCAAKIHDYSKHCICPDCGQRILNK